VSVLYICISLALCCTHTLTWTVHK